MGEVYRALDTRLERTVAIKVLASHLSSSPELKQRMEREARAISSLNHPNICHLYDVGSHEGTDYLVMELLEGETLADRLRRGAIPLNEIFKIGVAVADALGVAHHQGIVHRDLKPGNIMLTQSGAKPMDFGLAKPLGARSPSLGSRVAPSFTAAATLSGRSPLSPLTMAGSIIGTIQYMSPEQIEGKEADARSDIFAFGAVLYEMATGKRAFQGKSHLSTASSILEKDPDPISTVQPLAPKALEHTVQTCLAKNPEERFQDAHDLKFQLLWLAGVGAEGAQHRREFAEVRQRAGAVHLVAGGGEIDVEEIFPRLSGDGPRFELRQVDAAQRKHTEGLEERPRLVRQREDDRRLVRNALLQRLPSDRAFGRARRCGARHARHDCRAHDTSSPWSSTSSSRSC